MGRAVNVSNNRELTEAMAEYGLSYTANYMETLGNGEAMRLLVRVGSQVSANITINIIVPYDSVFKTYSMPDILEVGNLPDGVKLTKFNRSTVEDRDSRVDVYSDSTFNDLGLLRGLQPIHGGTGGNAVGSQSGERIPSVITSDNDFVIEVKNDTSGIGKFGIVIDWYEVDL